MNKLSTLGLGLCAGLLLSVGLGFVRNAKADEESGHSAYFCFGASDVMDLQTKANAAGQRGWQFAGAGTTASGNAWCFHKPH